MKPKVFLLITELTPAGAEKIVFSLATHLKEEFEIHVGCLSSRRGAVGDWLAQHGIPVLYLDLVRKFELWKLGKLYSYLKKNKIQLLHTHLFHANLIGRIIGKLARVPSIISTVHIVERRFRPWHFWFESLTHFCILYEICVSQSVLDFMQKKTWIPRKKFKAILNGISLAPFQEALKQHYSPEEVFSLPKKPDYIIGTVGRLSYQKGYPYLIEAFMQFCQQSSKEAFLVFVGEGESRAELEQLVEKKGLQEKVFFLGYRDDVAACLCCFDLFVMPSLYEGFGLVALEAMACQVPVLATNVDSLQELIQEGETGFLVPPKESTALAEKMLVLLQDKEERERIIRNANQWVNGFTEERMVEEYRALYYHIFRSEPEQKIHHQV